MRRCWAETPVMEAKTSQTPAGSAEVNGKNQRKNARIGRGDAGHVDNDGSRHEATRSDSSRHRRDRRNNVQTASVLTRRRSRRRPRTTLTTICARRLQFGIVQIDGAKVKALRRTNLASATEIIGHTHASLVPNRASFSVEWIFGELKNAPAFPYNETKREML